MSGRHSARREGRAAPAGGSTGGPGDGPGSAVADGPAGPSSSVAVDDAPAPAPARSVGPAAATAAPRPDVEVVRSGPPVTTTGVSAQGVVLTKDGWPLVGSAVTLLATTGTASAHATSGSDGRFVLTGLAAGPATLLAAAPGHEPQARSVVVPGAGASGGAGTTVVDLGELQLQRLGASALPAPGRWVIDSDHTALVATAHHLGLSSVNGRLSRLEGAIDVAEPFTASSVEVRIDADSIDTGVAARDRHLRSADFLDVVHHPTITYRGAGLTPDGAGGWWLDGELVLLETARPVRLHLTCTGTGEDPWGGQRVAFHATAQLNRDDFSMNWNQAFGMGVAIFGTTLRIGIDLEAVLQG